MDWLRTTLAIYGRVLGRGAQLVLRNWPLAAAFFAYGAVMAFATVMMFSVGLIGGFFVPIALAFCGGSFLYCVEIIVRSGKVTFDDFRASLGAYFPDVLGVMFALWIFRLVASMLASSPYGPAITVFSSLLVWVFFNAAPELIYLGHYSTMELLGESYQFILRNWIEWFPLNIVLSLALPAVWSIPVAGPFGDVLKIFAGGLAFYLIMVVRGLLFLELADSSRRSRIFRHRAQ